MDKEQESGEDIGFPARWAARNRPWTHPIGKYREKVRAMASVFFTGMFQVTFVAMNTVLVSKHFIIGAFSTSFMISWIWSHNVKKVAFGDELDRIAYASGAATGCLIGMELATRYFT